MIHKNLLIIICFFTVSLHAAESNNWPRWVKLATKIHVQTTYTTDDIDIEDTDNVYNVMVQLIAGNIIGRTTKYTLHPVKKGWFWDTKLDSHPLTGLIKQCMQTHNTATFWLKKVEKRKKTAFSEKSSSEEDN